MSIDLGVMIAIIQADQILLIKREDFEVWGLPAGQLEPGESMTQAAIREAYEETGLEVQLTRLVGIYFIPAWWANKGSHAILFAAKPIGGSLQPDRNEVVDIGYFHPNELPEPLMDWHRRRILDVLNGLGGSVVRSQNVHWPFDPGMTRQAIYQMRDQSGLSRQEFYLQHFGRYQAEEDGSEELGML
jgi:8-oxo-dGTP pyrophosphatase MutT (NUDIX family)